MQTRTTSVSKGIHYLAAANKGYKGPLEQHTWGHNAKANDTHYMCPSSHLHCYQSFVGF